jgi:hypothetical protein
MLALLLFNFGFEAFLLLSFVPRLILSTHQDPFFSFFISTLSLLPPQAFFADLHYPTDFNCFTHFILIIL